MIHFVVFIHPLTNNHLLSSNVVSIEKSIYIDIGSKKPKINTLEARVFYQPYKRCYINQLLQMNSSKPSKKTKTHLKYD